MHAIFVKEKPFKSDPEIWIIGPEHTIILILIIFNSKKLNIQTHKQAQTHTCFVFHSWQCSWKQQMPEL